MPRYQAPLDDIRFVLEDLLDVGQEANMPGFEEMTPDIFSQVIAEGAKLCEEVLFPLNQSGDAEGCSFDKDTGEVRTPAGFRQAYGLFAEGGWTGLACDPEYGGQGLPELLNFVVEEMICSANLAFGMYPGLTRGVHNALDLHASDEIKRRYLPRLIDGTWSGTMCLTEPQSGSDLGLVRTKAEPAEGGSYRVTGTKIFISAGEHDLTANIVHLVLARLPGAPAGTRGISLFIVPKFLPTDDEGGLGDRNAVVCGAIEHKMGIRASSTCVLNFDGAIGWLVGEANKGMRAMFTMMNAARLAVGIQGLGLAEVAWQNARAYAGERLQGRALKGARYPDKPADPLLVHPDVRRMLLTQKALIEGGRALAYWVGLAIDRAEHHPDAKVREAENEFVALMTPIVKALLTDIGFDVANLAVQVFGGAGYVRDSGVEQYVRDARITQIYEGTNGIQALDLVGRKLPQDMGRQLRRFFHPVSEELAAVLAGSDPVLIELATPLAKAFGRLQGATTTIAFKGLEDPDEAAAAASDYLRLFGLVALGAMWLRMAKVAQARPEHPLAASKLATARFYMAKLLPETSGRFSAIMAGAKTVMAGDWGW